MKYDADNLVSTLLGQVKENSIWDRNGNPVSGSYADSTTTSSSVVADNVAKVEPSTQEQGTPIATSETEDEPTSSSEAVNDKIASLRLPILAAKPTTTSSETKEEQPQATEESIAVESATTTTTTSSSSDVGDACNDKAGQWKCNGKALEQCIQGELRQLLT